MKKIIATSAGFEGEVHIVYDNDDGMLMTVDFAHALLNAKQVQYFMEKTPVYYAGKILAQQFSSKLTLVEESISITFSMFWLKYARKINKARCERIWDKLSKSDRVKAYYGIFPYDRHLQSNSWKSKADPETYLKNKYWENEWR